MYLYQHDGFDPTVSSLNSNSPQMVEILHMWGLYAARLEFLSNGVLLHSLHSIKVWISIRNQCEGGGVLKHQHINLIILNLKILGRLTMFEVFLTYTF